MIKILAIDIGNTCTSFAKFQNNTLINRENVLTKHIESFLSNYIVSENTKVIISSVVPEINKFFNKFKPKIVTHKDFISILSKIENPSEVGTDLLCKITSLDGAKAIIISFGTATTILLANPKLFGVTIIPGLKMQLSALNSGTSQLHYTEANNVVDLLGLNTTDAILSGVILSQAFAVNTFVDKLKKECGDLQVIITGGYSEFLVKHLNFEYTNKQNMVLEGLKRISLGE